MLKQWKYRIQTLEVWPALRQTWQRVKERLFGGEEAGGPLQKFWAAVRRPFSGDGMPHQPRYMAAALVGVVLLGACGLMVGGMAGKGATRGGVFAVLAGISGTPTPEPPPYAIQVGSPKYMRAFSHTEQGCQWVGVAGQVFDDSGEGVSGLAVLVTGSINDRPVEQIVFTEKSGVYGPGSYELFLADHLPDGPSYLEIRLLDMEFKPLSDAVILRVPEECNKNLALVNFQGAYDTQVLYFPSVGR